MREAQYYIYRNLNGDRKHFSIKQRGLVLFRERIFGAMDVEFRISEAGRRRVVEEQQRNVHAYAVIAPDALITGENQPLHPTSHMLWQLYDEITYNPYKDETFIWKRTGAAITEKVPYVLFKDGKVFGNMP